LKLLLLDNIDSFTFNLLHYLQIAGARVDVVRNYALNEAQLRLENYDGAVLSPGPCTPQDSKNLMEFVGLNAGKKPLLGVCLGMQAMGVHFGWKLQKAHIPRHGKSSLIQHSGKGIFKDLPNPLQVGRYHSLVICDPKNSSDLKVEALCEGEVMAVSSEDGLLWGVQFHPESILTPHGQQLIRQWVVDQGLNL
jgi:para-aminobenzoate synthetase component 2